MSLPARLFFSALFFATAIYFVIQGDHVLAAALAVTGIASFGGYRTGSVYIAGSLIGIGVAIALAPSIGRSQEMRFAEWFGTTGVTNRIVSIGTVGVIISFVVSMIVFFVGGMFLANRPRLDTLNRWIGFAIGSLQGAFAVLLFLGGLMVLEPIEKERADTRDPLDLRGQFVSKWILNIADQAHQSRLAPIVDAYNPFTKIPQLNKVEEIQQSVRILGDPQKIDDLIHHPSIESLAERPEMKRVIEELTTDPEVQRILQSGQPINRETALTLMNHPAVLELIDQPGFVEEAYRIIQNAGKKSPSGSVDEPSASDQESDSSSTNTKTSPEERQGEIGVNPFAE